jgi:hypothetical protein
MMSHFKITFSDNLPSQKLLSPTFPSISEVALTNNSHLRSYNHQWCLTHSQK